MQNLLLSLAACENDGIQADYCVVGSGPAGSVIACELARRGKDVLLLEAGGPFTPAVEDSINEIDIEGRQGLASRRAALLGGSSNIWGGLVSALEPSDFAATDMASGLGWPISFADLEPYYRRACRLMNLDWRSLDPSQGARRFCFGSPDLAKKKFAISDPPFSMRRHVESIVHGYQRGRLRVLTDAAVAKINITPEGVVQSVNVISPARLVLKVEARIFVIAAGGIETPRLLLSSNDVQTDGIGNGFGLVGRYFSTHPKGELGCLRLNRQLSRRTRNAFHTVISGAKGYVGTGLSPSHIKDHGQLNHYVQLSPLWLVSVDAFLDRLRRKAHKNQGYVAAVHPGLNTVRSLRRKGLDILTTLAPRQLTDRACVLTGHFDQLPQHQNRITLSAQRDNMGYPKVDVHWRFSAFDRTSIAHFFETLRLAFRRNDIGTLEGDISRRLDEGDFTAFHSHHLGATRMSADEKSGVVDPAGKVFSTTNLYLCGPSVFSTYGFSNPFLTTVALAYRLADHLTKCL
jgi:choline dehydrogenase-like flavoprotein